MERAPPSDEDLHAYLDGELPEGRRAQVEAYLHTDPAAAERLAAYRADGEAIARIFAAAGDLADAPSHPRPPQPISERPRRAVAGAWPRALMTPWWRAAAIVLVVAGALAAGWLGLRGGLESRDRSDDALWARFGAEALVAHLALGDARSEPTVAASWQDISDYLSATLGTHLEVHDPSSSGYLLVGSSFLTGAKGRVVQLAFRGHDGKLLTMYLEPWPSKKDAPFREVATQSEVTTMVWVDHRIGCAVSATLPPDRLEQVARTIYEAMLG